MGGTFDYAVLVVVRVEYAFRGWKHVGGDGFWCARCWVLRDRACCFAASFRGSWVVVDRASWAFVVRLCVVRGWYRSYVENYTVDASILNAANVDRLRMVGFVVFSNFSQEFLRMK